MSMKAIYPVYNSRSAISIRPLRIPDDVTYIEQWAGVEAVACFTSLYESIELADFIESVMVWNNNEPLFQADICLAPFDEISTSFTTMADDYTLRFLMPNEIDNRLFMQGLLKVLDYGFGEKKAGRILVPVYENNKMLSKWFDQAGCTIAPGFTYRQLFGIYVVTKTAFQTLD